MTQDQIKDTADTAAVLSGIAVWMQYIPAIVGIVTICYTVWRFLVSLDYRKRNKQWPFSPFGSEGTNGGKTLVNSPDPAERTEAP